MIYSIYKQELKGLAAIYGTKCVRAAIFRALINTTLLTGGRGAIAMNNWGNTYDLNLMTNYSK